MNVYVMSCFACDSQIRQVYFSVFYPCTFFLSRAAIVIPNTAENTKYDKDGENAACHHSDYEPRIKFSCAVVIRISILVEVTFTTLTYRDRLELRTLFFCRIKFLSSEASVGEFFHADALVFEDYAV